MINVEIECCCRIVTFWTSTIRNEQLYTILLHILLDLLVDELKQNSQHYVQFEVLYHDQLQTYKLKLSTHRSMVESDNPLAID